MSSLIKKKSNGSRDNPPVERYMLQQQHAVIMTTIVMIAMIGTFSKHSLLQIGTR